MVKLFLKIYNQSVGCVKLSDVLARVTKWHGLKYHYFSRIPYVSIYEGPADNLNTACKIAWFSTWTLHSFGESYYSAFFCAYGVDIGPRPSNKKIRGPNHLRVILRWFYCLSWPFFDGAASGKTGWWDLSLGNSNWLRILTMVHWNSCNFFIFWS